MNRNRKKLTSNPGGGHVCIIHFQDSKTDKFTLISDKPDAVERLKKLKDISRRRLSQPSDSPYRLAHICSQIPISLSPEHGYHRHCYQRFTSNLARLDQSHPSTSSLQTDSSRSSKRSSTDKFIFHPDCIFCRSEGRKKLKKSQCWTSEFLSNFEFGGGDTIVKAATEKQDHDLLRRIKGYDLFACEAQFHPSCRKRYTIDPEQWRSHDEDQKVKQQNLEESHKLAYAQVCSMVENTLIQKKGIMKLSDLVESYREALQKTPYPNLSYRSEKLQLKLEKSYPERLIFLCLEKKGQFQPTLIYSSNIDIGNLVRLTYELSNINKAKDVALELRSFVFSAFQNSESLRWPPTAQQLEGTDNLIPEELIQFLKYLVTGRNEVESRKNDRLVQSFGQDLCRAATHGQWKLPKHIFLSMTLRHLFRSAQLVTLINRFGHCENYTFSLELEEALAQGVKESSQLLSSQIVRNPSGESLFHSDFDNFDQNTATSSIHTAHGIMLQEIDESQKLTVPLPESERSKQKKPQMICDTDQIPDCYLSTRKSPGYNITRWTYTQVTEAETAAYQCQMLWVFVRMLSSDSSQEVPGWPGFVSVTGEAPASTTTIDYYPVINCPITEYKTVQECLRYSEQATQEVGQDYVITTFDLGVCMKAYPLVWNHPARYEKHIVMIGSFHVVCAYLKMVGKKMQGTGLGDVLMEAGLISSGSLHGVLSGKQYSRALVCHKSMLEALERLLITEFLEVTKRPNLLDGLEDEHVDQIQELLESPSKTSLQACSINGRVTSFLQEYQKFKDDVRHGSLGKTAKLWLSYMDHIWKVLSLIQAVKINNLRLYCQCLYEMSDLFFSFDGQNYSRYLTFFSRVSC